MTTFPRGAKADLANVGCGRPFTVAIDVTGADLVIDLACFGLDARGKLSDERYLVFYNQTASPCDAVRMGEVRGVRHFVVDVGRLPASIDRLVFTATIDGPGTMRQLGACSLSLGDATFSFNGADFDQGERAVMIGQLYRHDGRWRFGAVGEGFAGGLAALLTHFGATVAEPQAHRAPARRVTLTKPEERHTIALEKHVSAPAELIVHATWEENGDGRGDNDDLDLRAGLLLPDGRMHLITAPDRPGDFAAAPYVRHLGDTRSASGPQPMSETILVNPAIARLTGGRVAVVFSVYSAVSNGPVPVASLKPRMRMEYGSEHVECAYDFATSRAARRKDIYTYVIGVAIIDAESVVLTPGGQTSGPGSEKTPWLTWQGQDVAVTMDGQAVFKGCRLGSGAACRPNRRYS